MSSPRGFAAGGMGAIGRDVDADLARGLATGVGDVERDEVAGAWSSGLGKKNASGFHANWDRKGGLRTFRYMLKERRARFAWGTYLEYHFSRWAFDEFSYSLVCIGNFFRVHATGKEQDESCDTDKEKATGKVWMHCDLGFGCWDELSQYYVVENGDERVLRGQKHFRE